MSASGAAYRDGRPDDVERYVELGLALGRDIEFFSGNYRLELTRACAHAGRGHWGRAEDSLRSLLARPGDPGMMEPLARALLARLLARQGRADEAIESLAPARAVASTSVDVRLVGPVAAAELEVAWLAGTGAGLVEIASRAIALAHDVQHTVTSGELSRYLQRAGCAAPDVVDAPEPWASGLRGDWQTAAALWTRARNRTKRHSSG